MLATARELGIDEVYAVGGAQAIAALAYGTETVRPVAKIVGPGNRWVTAAKLLVSSRVAIDLPAGPSEVLVVADGRPIPTSAPPTCSPRPSTAPTARPCSSPPARRSPRRSPPAATAAPARGGRVAGGRDRPSERVRARAPRAARRRSRGGGGRVVNAGSVFLGTTAVLGDYASGANHVLPTGGLARGAGGLGLEAFLKPIQYVRATAEGVAAAAETVEALAALEGLPLHAASVGAR